MDIFENKIKKDIEKSGLPLEIDVNYILNQKGWNVRNQVSFFDQTENKHRPIDIMASKLIEVKSPGLDRLNVTLIIECKKSVKPWVFYTVPKGELHWAGFGKRRFFHLP